MILPLGPESALRRQPYVTFGLLAINLLVYLAHNLFATDWLDWILWGGLVPARITTVAPFSIEGLLAYSTLLTCAFLHGGLLHLLGNAFFLYAYGCKLEERLGHLRFLLFYLLVQFCMALVYVLLYADRALPLVGASGAISGIMGAYLLKFPHTRIRAVVWVFIRVWVLRIPAYVLLGFWLLMNVLYASVKSLSGMTNVAWSAHLLGFGFGLLWIGVWTGYRIESDARAEATHDRKETLRSLGLLLKGEAIYLLLLIALPLLMYAMAWSATFAMAKPALVYGHYTMRIRAQYAFYLLFNNYPIYVLIIGLVFGAIWLRRRQRRMEHVLNVDTCLLCLAHDTHEDEEGFVQCRACGFDTRFVLDDYKAPWIGLLRDVRMSQTFLAVVDKQIAAEIAQSSLVAFTEDHLKGSFDAYEEAMETFRDVLARHRERLTTLLAVEPAGASQEVADGAIHSAREVALSAASFAAKDLPMLGQMIPTYINADGTHKSIVALKREQQHILQVVQSFLVQIATIVRGRLTKESGAEDSTETSMLMP